MYSVRNKVSANTRTEMGLLEEPAWQHEDLGKPLPDSDDACSVALPTWNAVIGYEEGRERVMKKLRSGYPRFVINDKVKRLFDAATRDCGRGEELAFIFASQAIAQRAQRYVELQSGSASRVVSYEGMYVLLVDAAQQKTAAEYWRYTGEIISSRMAGDALAEGIIPNRSEVQEKLRVELCKINGASPEDVFLFESGMAGIFAAHRAVIQLTPGKKTLQMEFPYVDAMRVQQNFGSGAVFLNLSEGEDSDEALQRIRRGEFAAVFTEMPSNPLMRCVNLPQVSEACRAGDTPLIVDDTISSSYNVDVMPYADAVTSSLTKWISGKGDVCAGQVTLNPDSPHYSDLQSQMHDICQRHRLYVKDAQQLLLNIQDFPQRIRKVNENGEALYELLSTHPKVQQCWYPKGETLYRYEEVKRPAGGYGGLVSFLVKGGARKAQKCFDSLEISKGPGLGTEFSLVCPYTLLAHYDDLEWAEHCGVPRNLLRISAGIEDTNVLLARVSAALDVL